MNRAVSAISVITYFCIERLYSRTMDTERSLIDGRTGSVQSSGVAPICPPQNIHDHIVKDENEEIGVSTHCVREVRQSYVFRKRNTDFTPPLNGLR